MKEAVLGEKNPNFKNKGHKTCLECGSYYHSYQKNRKYCSAHCSNINNRIDKSQTLAEARKKAKTPKKPAKLCKGCNINKPRKKGTIYCLACKPEKKTTISCKVCGKEVEGYKSRLKKYCGMSCRDNDKKGANNPRYIDGRTPENKSVRNSKDYKNWRNEVFKRDNYTCVWCGQIGGELNADHIKPFSTHQELRLDLDNGRTLCVPCHTKTPTYKTRKPIKLKDKFSRPMT